MGVKKVKTKEIFAISQSRFLTLQEHQKSKEKSACLKGYDFPPLLTMNAPITHPVVIVEDIRRIAMAENSSSRKK